jgi:pSer/pThr/pTyr-binding forkhead associated (FHA) protein
MATLSITTGPAQGQSIECNREVVVGREGVDFLVDDDEASRRHTAIRPGPRGIEVEDLGSLNGTFVNGQRIDGVAVLTSSATLRIGQTELALEVAPADLPIAQPQPTVARERPAMPSDAPIADPQRTVARERPPMPSDAPIADPQRTVARERPPMPSDTPIAEPQRTAVRQTPADDSSQRAEPSDQPIAAPEVTTVRQTVPPPAAPVAPGAGAAPGPPGAPAVPPGLPPSAVARPPGPGRGRRPGPPAGARIVIPLLLVVIVAVVVLLLTGVI